MIYKITYRKPARFGERLHEIRVAADTLTEAKVLASASGTVKSWLENGFHFHAIYIAI